MATKAYLRGGKDGFESLKAAKVLVDGETNPRLATLVQVWESNVFVAVNLGHGMQCLHLRPCTALLPCGLSSACEAHHALPAGCAARRCAISCRPIDAISCPPLPLYHSTFGCAWST